MKKTREIDKSAAAKSAKAEWMQAEANLNAASERPSDFLLGVVVVFFVFAIAMAAFGWLILPSK